MMQPLASARPCLNRFRWRARLVVLLMLGGLTACATYYQANQSFNEEFERGDLQRALTVLQQNAQEGRGKKEFLYLVNNGLVLSVLGRYEESNEFLEKAYLFGEDFRRNYVNEVASYLTNPAMTVYRGEDHEHLLLLYYKAINYLKMSRHEEALVECRRLNLRLQQMSDRYTSENKYREDAFVHNLMGIIYDADKDYNNAFIAYRNAFRIYEESYARMFQLKAPRQLQWDLLRTARLSGFQEEADQWQTEWGLALPENPNPDASLVFFWHNGLSPIKAEWSVNFVITRQQNWVAFRSPELNLEFPFSMEDYDETDRKDLANLEVVRVAFPRYVERQPHFQKAELRLADATFPLEPAEDINRVAFKGLEQRMHLEFSKALLRVALKKVAEHELRKSDRALGSVLGMINAITEKADTRNWQTLPYQICYTRLPLKVGRNRVVFTTHAEREKAEYEFTYEAHPGETLFHTFTSLESKYPSYSYY